MKPAQASVRALVRSHGARSLSSTPLARDVSFEAESSTAASSAFTSVSPPPPTQNFSSSQTNAASTSSVVTPGTSAKGQARPNESFEESWKRNLSEAKEWRRRAALIREQTPSAMPSSSRTRSGPTETSLSTLMASGAALGHSTSLLSVPFTPYVYGNRSGLSIIDLQQTLPLLRRAAAVTRDIVRADGVVLFVGTREAHSKAVVKAKDRLEDNGFAVLDWMPGTLTNSETYFGMRPMLDGYYLPDLVIFLNPSENLGAIRECTARNVPTIGIIDTDTDPRIVTYPIPANMESVRTAELVAATLSIAGQQGRKARLEAANKEEKRKRAAGEHRRQAAGRAAQH